MVKMPRLEHELAEMFVQMPNFGSYVNKRGVPNRNYGRHDPRNSNAELHTVRHLESR